VQPRIPGMPGGLHVGPCINETLPAIEYCDGLDTDCDGYSDEYDDYVFLLIFASRLGARQLYVHKWAANVLMVKYPASCRWVISNRSTTVRMGGQ